MRNLLKIDCLVIKKLTFLQNNMSRAYRCIFRKKAILDAYTKKYRELTLRLFNLTNSYIFEIS